MKAGVMGMEKQAQGTAQLCGGQRAGAGAAQGTYVGARGADTGPPMRDPRAAAPGAARRVHVCVCPKRLGRRKPWRELHKGGRVNMRSCSAKGKEGSGARGTGRGPPAMHAAPRWPHARAGARARSSKRRCARRGGPRGGGATQVRAPSRPPLRRADADARIGETLHVGPRGARASIWRPPQRGRPPRRAPRRSPRPPRRAERRAFVFAR
ncbi:MAG: hypothetical protein J3K34DRAFT_224953 [Monoraphidium minutum]|nr:MAG: hypothetical protein J3K34DRAFT_224953 [Monoraphidium minutum]